MKTQEREVRKVANAILELLDSIIERKTHRALVNLKVRAISRALVISLSELVSCLAENDDSNVRAVQSVLTQVRRQLLTKGDTEDLELRMLVGRWSKGKIVNCSYPLVTEIFKSG